MCPLDPSSPGAVLARKLARIPIDAASSFTPNFTSAASSAARRPRRGSRFNSSNPGPASVCTAERSTPSPSSAGTSWDTNSPYRPISVRLYLMPRHGIPAAIPQADLVFQRRHRLEPELPHLVQHVAEHLSRGEVAGGAVGPARSRQADAPSWTPRQLVDGLGIRVHDQVGRAGPDAGPFEIGDGGVHRVEAQDQVGHHGSVAYRRLERGGPQRLPADRPVDVGDPEQHELRVPCAAFGDHVAAAGLDSARLMVRSTSPIAAANRSTISPSSSSVLVYAGASSTWSPA